MKPNFKNIAGIIAVVSAASFLSACGEGQQGQLGGMPPQPVDVAPVKIGDVPVISSLIGRATAVRTAEIRPQVSGVILKRFFTEGAVVKQGDQLYQIDPAVYEAQLASARAALAQAEANLYTAQLKFGRYSKLINTNSISKQEYDDSLAGNKAAEAQVLSAKAAVKSAEINLAYTKVYAPITGTIGRSNATEGALVTNGQANPMATIQQLDPMYVDLNMSVTDHLNLKRSLANGAYETTEQAGQVSLFLENGEPLDEKGVLEFSEVTVDETMGTVTVRVKVPNPNGYLLPGMYIKADINQGVRKNTLLVPQISVLRQNNGTTVVYTLSPDNVITAQTVVLGGESGHDYIIRSGVTATDRVVTSNLQKIGPGMTVTPVEPQPETQAEPQKEPQPETQAESQNEPQKEQSGKQ